jgi:hypothetical protein
MKFIALSLDKLRHCLETGQLLPDDADERLVAGQSPAPLNRGESRPDWQRHMTATKKSIDYVNVPI